jgi:hypothetical protein
VTCFYGVLQTLDEAVSAEWLRQVADRASRQRLCAGLLVGECGKKDEWNAIVPGTQVILQLHTAHTWHLDVRHYAGEVIKPV